MSDFESQDSTDKAGHDAQSVLICLATAPSTDVAAAMAKTLVSEGLVACVSLLPGARSIYAWQGKVCDESEVWMMIKTTQAAWSRLQARWIEIHPYEVPELIAWPVRQGLPAYLEWVHASVQPNANRQTASRMQEDAKHEQGGSEHEADA